MHKRHIRNHKRTISGPNYPIFVYFCGIVESDVTYPFYFTPLDSDNISYVKKQNVCMSCYKNWLGRKNYIKRLENENVTSKNKSIKE